MEFSERKRRRKSQSFKLVHEQEQDFDARSFDNAINIHVNGASKDTAMPEAWLGDEGVEIKRQITGMMRLLSDKAGRMYQRVGAEGNSLKQEPQEEHLSWAQPAALPPDLEDPQISVWSSAGETEPSPMSIPNPVPNGQGSGQYGTRSKTQRMLNTTTKGTVKTNDEAPAVVEAPCCMCNCKSTLQAILQELRTMRRLMQTQKGSQEKQEHRAPPCPPCPVPTASRRRPRKRRPVHKVAPLSAPSMRAAVPPLPPSSPTCVPLESGGRRERGSRELERPVHTPASPSISTSPELSVQTLSMQNKPIPGDDTHNPNYRQPKGLQTSESEVRLAEDYEVFIPKAQLDSILVNYTRSGSLLFRKLVCAFFDDTTLANSLPNGKRKRGLNDQRKGLDQNIVGAIKVFTEKYCTAHRIEKLPGPRDWVQILQDQIKLARRRLKRAEATDPQDIFNRPCTESLQLSGEREEREFLTTGCDYNKPACLVKVGKNVTD
ncbi:BEN domain-containing protein 7 isoform X1 [Salmo salar]|uniref:BEN domain-containing protein 7 isoform X1 n=1 Tax=Salmo salar TaxID=8030 RepID=A0A1S3ML14_SALSA|nr:BEN domain-containing protein 7 isoform X1 [Salmo salar]|eukprot:XP_014003918.1 PREDICTED: BEN domain-containing protein 7 isoform X1 [Salmo salar]